MEATIYITGEIGTFHDLKGVELIDVISQVKAQPNATSLKVIINSPGGVVETGFDIYNYLKSLNIPIHTIGIGTVASIATVILMAGDKRSISAGTEFMIHLPWVQHAGTADEIEAIAKDLRITENQLLNFYKKELNLTEEAILPILKNETYLTKQQAFDLGFVTENIQPLKAVAYFNINKKENEMTNENKNWIEGLFKKFAFAKPEMVAKTETTGDGSILEFKDVADDAVIAVGDKATVEGVPAEGEILMPNGETYVFDNGELIEIKAAEGSEDIEAIKAENESLKAQLASVATIATENATLKNEIVNIKKQITSKFVAMGKTDAKKEEEEIVTNTAAERLAKLKR